MAVILVEHFDADSAGRPLSIVGGGQGQALDLVLLEPVHGETVAHAGELPLEFVQHGRGEVGVSYKIGGEQRDLPFVCLGWKGDFGFAGAVDIDVGELLVAHLDRFFQDTFPSGVGEQPCVVDCFGYGVARYAQRICDILNGDAVSHGRSHPFLIFIL